ncbi:MAG: hypothetical protein WCS70_02720 [Verrucomicrobiota bacterium]
MNSKNSTRSREYGDPATAEFFFVAVWFNQYCVVVHVGEIFRQHEPYLAWRGFTKAAARQTVHVVWDLPEPPPLLAELIPLFREANFKLVVKSPGLNRDLFDEVQNQANFSGT